MSGQQFCTFFLRGIYFGINIQQIQEVIRYQEITHVPLAPSDIRGVINLRGEIVTVIDLQSRLEIIQQNNLSPIETQSYQIIVHNDGELISFLVDGIEDILEIEEQKIEIPPATVKGKMRKFIQGIYQMENRFLLILNVEKILHYKLVNEFDIKKI